VFAVGLLPVANMEEAVRPPIGARDATDRLRAGGDGGDPAASAGEAMHLQRDKKGRSDLFERARSAETLPVPDLRRVAVAERILSGSTCSSRVDLSSFLFDGFHGIGQSTDDRMLSARGNRVKRRRAALHARTRPATNRRQR
jgi:hypothetical protein